MFESRNFCWSNWKISRVEETSRKNCLVVLRHGRSCEKVRWKMLWAGEQEDMAVVRSLNSVRGWSPFHERGTGISWRIVESMLTNCLEMLVPGTNLVDLTFYGQWINLHDRLQNGPKLVTNAWIDLFHTFIAHVNTDNIVMWVILLNNADWDCCKIPTLQEILRTENPLLEEHCAFFGSHTFVPISWMCKKQTWVSHSSTESEIISLDAGLRLDGIPALDSSDLIVSVLGNTTQNHDRTERPVVSTSEIWSSHDSQT